MSTFKKRVQTITGSKVTGGSYASVNMAIYQTETADQETLYLARFGDWEQLNYGKIVPEEEMYKDIDSLYDVIVQAIKDGYQIYIDPEIQEYFYMLDPNADFWQELEQEVTEEAI